MKKVLIISGLQIFPPESGGQLRTANLASSLGQLGYQVEIYSFTGRKKDYLERMKSSEFIISKNILEYTNRLPLLGVLQWFCYKIKWPPIWLTLLTQFILPKKLKEMSKGSDRIIIDFPFLYPLKKKLGSRIILNTHNAEFNLYKDRPILSSIVKKLEIQAFSKVEKILFCHENDLNAFQLESIKEKSFILTNGLDLSRFVTNNEDRSNIRRSLRIKDDQFLFLFTGSQYAPNVEAYLFLKKFEEKERTELHKNKICLVIVGTVAQEKVDLDTFKVLGRVESVMPYFSATDYCLNPCRSGSGTNVKMFEYLAAKKLILSTDFGKRGLQLEDQIDCLVFSEDNFLNALKKAINLKNEEKGKMEERAFSRNIDLLDMKQQLKNLITQW